MKGAAQHSGNGTYRPDRMIRALVPESVSVDERSTREWLIFAQEFAKKLCFYNNQNIPDGDWSGLFDLDLQEMLAFLEKPEDFFSEPKKRQKFSRPHLVLFFAFLHLLKYPQQQFQSLTRRHLEFYYTDVLRFHPKPAMPDCVHVLFELSPKTATHLLKKGTILDAGTDTQGNALQYALDEDVILTRAHITDIKTFHLKRIHQDLQHIHEREGYSDEGFESLVRQALGSPAPGDSLPLFFDEHGEEHIVDSTFLKTLYHTLHRQEFTPVPRTYRDYILQALCFLSIEDFLYCLRIQLRQTAAQPYGILPDPPTPEEWQRVYNILERASRKKTNLERRRMLREEYLNPYYDSPDQAFDGVMRLALGEPAPGDPLPPLPNSHDTVKTLAAKLSEPPVMRYIEEDLCLSREDFHRILALQHEVEESGVWPERADMLPEWEDMFRLLAQAQVIKRGWGYPSLHTEEIRSCTMHTISPQAGDLDTQPEPFPPFGSETGGSLYHPGLAIAAPLLQLPAGRKTITLQFACSPDFHERERFSRMFHDEGLPFTVILHSGQHRITPDRIAWRMDTAFSLILSFDEHSPVFLPATTLPFQTSWPVITIHLQDVTQYPMFSALRFFQFCLQATITEEQYIRLTHEDVVHTPRHTPSSLWLDISTRSTVVSTSSTLSYSASEECIVGEMTAEHTAISLYHLHPFGFLRLNDLLPAANLPFFPEYPHEGYLFIGLKDCQPSQSLSLLFQLAEGSGNPAMPLPEVQWRYLSRSGWNAFIPGEHIADRTHRLSQSGILRVRIPEDAAQRHTLMPDGCIWLRAQVANNSTAIPELREIRSQAARAGRESGHIVAALPPFRVCRLVKRDYKVKSVTQPYSSFGGAPPERPNAFYTRVSERLRHKQRALTTWDYEHLVLERFPAVYAVKCLSPAPGEVRIIVVPDLSHDNGDDKHWQKADCYLRPKLPYAALQDIQAYLQQRTTPFITLTVKNPRYEQLTYRVIAQFPSKVPPEEYLRQLNTEIVRYLSPWRDNRQTVVPFFSELRHAGLLRHITQRSSVTRVVALTLTEHLSDSGIPYPLDDLSLARTRHPEAILVPAPQHQCEIFKGCSYEFEHFEGIESMTVGDDFTIGPPSSSQEAALNDMRLDEDFVVR